MEPTPIVSVPSADLSPVLSQALAAILTFLAALWRWLHIAVNSIVAISIPVALFFLIGIIYTTERLKYIRKKEAEKFDLKVEPAFEDTGAAGNVNLSARWEKVGALINSGNQNDWKQAILEADIMLDDILTGLGYRGETIGEKLKRVQPGEFKTIEHAWAAHQVRNRIAHDGSAFQLTHHDANETIQHYRRVFEEFYYI